MAAPLAAAVGAAASKTAGWLAATTGKKTAVVASKKTTKTVTKKSATTAAKMTRATASDGSKAGTLSQALGAETFNQADEDVPQTAAKVQGLAMIVALAMIAGIAAIAIPIAGVATAITSMMSQEECQAPPGTVGSEGGSVNVDTQGSESNAKYIWMQLLKNGYTEQQAAGVLGNLEQESNFEPTADQAGGPGMGIAQWSEGARWSSLTSWANKQGKDPMQLSTQVEFMLREMKQGVNGYNDKMFRNKTTVNDATVYFHNGYEGSADSPSFVINTRGGYSQAWYDRLRGSTGVIGLSANVNNTTATAPTASGAGSSDWTTRINEAHQYARTLKHNVSLTVVDVDTHKVLGGFNQTDTGKIASMAKAFTLAAYLDTNANRSLNGDDKALLEAMIRRSSDDALVAVRNKIGYPGNLQRWIRSNLALPSFTFSSAGSGVTPVSSKQMATAFSRLEQAMPSKHRAYGMGLLSSIDNSQQWGMITAADAAGWQWHVKGGWLDEQVHQTGIFVNGGQRIAVSIMQTGVSGATESGIDNRPEQQPGPDHLEAMTTALLVGGEATSDAGAAATNCGTGAVGGGSCTPYDEAGKNQFAQDTGFSYDQMHRNAQLMIDCVMSEFPGSFRPTTYGGHMPTQSMAIDFMILGRDDQMWTGDECAENPQRTLFPQDLADGTKLTQYLNQYHKEIGIDYFIWQDKKRNPVEYSDENEWAPLSQWRPDTFNNGDCNNVHFNHVHVSVTQDPGTGMVIGSPTSGGSATGWQLPLGKKYPVNSWGSPAGMRQHPIYGDWRCHDGTDISAPGGHPIYAANAGKVVMAGVNGGYGNFVKIDHGGGITTGYAHMSSIAVKNGQQVSAGYLIGKVGTTGTSTGNHLHFEVRQHDISGSPETWYQSQQFKKAC